MKRRELTSIDTKITEVGLGTWQLGARWGEEFSQDEAMKILNTAYESGITFIDTADVYNDGKSELAIGEFLKGKDDVFVNTKCGRALDPHTTDMYTPEAIEGFVNGSLERMQVERLDMIMLHCPPTEVYSKKEVFAKLDELKQSGKIRSYGVSVEKVSEAIEAMNYDISSIEIIFNMFRLKPKEELFELAKEKGVGIIARVPLASGLLTGKYTKDTTFGKDDHRTFNRDGESFDKGETFSGVDYELGLKAVEELKALFNTDNLIPYALKWILMHDAVTAVIPGVSKASQLASNIEAAELDDLSEEQMAGVEEVYNKYIRESVHPNW